MFRSLIFLHLNVKHELLMNYLIITYYVVLRWHASIRIETNGNLLLRQILLHRLLPLNENAKKMSSQTWQKYNLNKTCICTRTIYVWMYPMKKPTIITIRSVVNQILYSGLCFLASKMRVSVIQKNNNICRVYSN